MSQLNLSTETSYDYTTTDGSFHNTGSYDLPEGTSTILDTEIIAVTSSGVTARWRLSVIMKRVGSGDITIGPGTVVDLIQPQKDLGALTWDVRFNLLGSYFNLEVKGAANTTVNWLLRGGFTDSVPHSI